MNKIVARVKRIKHLEYKLLSIILILALFSRLYKIKNPLADWHSFRQADTASVTRTYVQEGINLLFPRYHDISTTQSGIFNPEGNRFVEFPIYNAIHALFYKAFPLISLEIWGRLISVFASLVSTYLLFLLGRRFINVYGGVLAALFFACTPFNIYFTRVILPEPMAIAFALAGIWFFVKFIDEEKIRVLYLSATLFAISILIKPFTIFYGIPLIYLGIRKYGLKGFLKKKRLLLAATLVIIPFMLWRIWMQQFPEGIPFWKWTFNGDGIRFRPSFWRWIFGERLGRLILGYWGLIPFSFGILVYKKGREFIYLFLLAMFLYVSTFATANVRHDYYQTIIMPAISLTLACGVLYMWENKVFNKYISRGLLVFSLSLMITTSAYQVREFYKVNHPEIIQAGRAVDRLTSKEALVIAAYNGDTAFLYQTKRKGWPVVDRPIDELIKRGADYYVSVNFDHPQTREFAERFEVVKKTDEFVIVKLTELDPNDTN